MVKKATRKSTRGNKSVDENDPNEPVQSEEPKMLEGINLSEEVSESLPCQEEFKDETIDDCNKDASNVEDVHDTEVTQPTSDNKSEIEMSKEFTNDNEDEKKSCEANGDNMEAKTIANDADLNNDVATHEEDGDKNEQETKNNIAKDTQIEGEKIHEDNSQEKVTVEITRGQRKWGHPPKDYDGPDPPIGSEIYVGNLPPHYKETEILDLVKTNISVGVWGIRLMMDKELDRNKSFGFITFFNPEDAQKAVKILENLELGGKTLKASLSRPNNRLFVGNIPKNKSKDELMEHFSKVSSDLEEVVLLGFISTSETSKVKNRGFCLLVYPNHEKANIAKRKFDKSCFFSGRFLNVEWAEEPEDEPDLSEVKILYVRPLAPTVDDATLSKEFSAFGEVERVKKLRDYAFIHYNERSSALAAIEGLHMKEINGTVVQVSLARPMSDERKIKKKKKEFDMKKFQHSPFHGDPNAFFNNNNFSSNFYAPRGRGGGSFNYRQRMPMGYGMMDSYRSPMMPNFSYGFGQPNFGGVDQSFNFPTRFAQGNFGIGGQKRKFNERFNYNKKNKNYANKGFSKNNTSFEQSNTNQTQQSGNDSENWGNF